MDDWNDMEDDWPEEDWSADAGDDLENDVVECPCCGAEIYEDAVQCPVCGEYVIHSRTAWSGRPLWWIVLGALGTVAVIAALTTA